MAPNRIPAPGGRHWGKPVGREGRYRKKKKGMGDNAGFYGQEGVVDSYLKRAEKAIGRRRYKEAENALRIAGEIDPYDSRVKAKLKEIDSLQKKEGA